MSNSTAKISETGLDRMQGNCDLNHIPFEQGLDKFSFFPTLIYNGKQAIKSSHKDKLTYQIFNAHMNIEWR